MDILRLLTDYKIDYVTDGHKHSTQGWVNVHCPWCDGSKNYHLGFEMANEFFVCWRCGWHPRVETIAKLLGVTPTDARIIIREYGGKRAKSAVSPKRELIKEAFRFPTNMGVLSDRHKRYLRKRGFDPDFLEQEWYLKGTGPSAFLNGSNYSFRIIIPIFWQKQIVSFQGRDITGKSDLKYMACLPEVEVISLKKILYRHPDAFGNRCICTEGVTDVWRIGRDAVATLGIKYTPTQMRLLSSFKKIVIWYDEEPQAQEQAHKLAIELRMKSRDIEVVNFVTDGDPGEASQKKVRDALDILKS